MRRLLVAAGILVLSFAAYAPSLQFKYVQDSFHAVKINPVVERGDVGEIFTSDYWKDTISLARTLYRPVTVSSFAVERAATGEADPRISHLLNILLHAGAAFLLFLLARRIGAGEFVATVAAAVFTVHPLLLQAVVNVVGRADLLAVLFSLAALTTFSLAGRDPAGSEPGRVIRRFGAWGTGLLVFAALGSKEIGIVVVPMMLVFDLLYRFPDRPSDRAWWIDRVGAWSPSVVAILAYLHLRTIAIGDFPGWQRLAAEDNVLVGLEGVAQVATALAMLTRYVGLLFWPRAMSPDYSGTVIGRESSLLALLPLAGLVALLILVFLAMRPLVTTVARRGPSPPARRSASFGAWLFLTPYLLIGNLLVLNAAGFAERLIYFSATGFCLLLALGIDRAVSWFPVDRRTSVRWGSVALVSIVLLAGIVQTRRESQMWATNDGMFAHALKVAPRSLRANLARAGDLEAEGRFDEALSVYEWVNEIAPDYGGAWLSRGVLLAREGDLSEAERSLRRAADVRPGVGDVHKNLGLVLLHRGDREGAQRELRRALLLNPGLVTAAAQLGHILFQDGRYAEAARFYGGCVQLGREDLRGNLREALSRARASGTPLR